MRDSNHRDRFKPRGLVECHVTKGAPKLITGPLSKRVPQIEGFPKVYDWAKHDYSNTEKLDHFVKENIIVNLGKDKVITALSTGFINVVARMAIGDRGTIPTDPTVPKVPVSTADTLFNEIYRDDLDATVLDVGTPDTHEVTFIKTFSAVVIPISSFSNQAKPVVNEVGILTADILGGTPLPRAPVAAPNPPEADEELFAIRTFKSVPFEAANEISVTIRYTIFVE